MVCVIKTKKIDFTGLMCRVKILIASCCCQQQYKYPKYISNLCELKWEIKLLLFHKKKKRSELRFLFIATKNKNKKGIFHFFNR